MKVTDLEKDPETAWVSHILQIAKKNLIDSGGSLEPVLFVRGGEGEFVICPLTQLGDINKDEDKDVIAAGARVACKQLNATACAFLSDAWRSEAQDDEAGEALMEAGNYSDLPDAMKNRVIRREAITLAIETRGRPSLIVAQFYRRGPGPDEITFEEADVNVAVGENRLTGLLPDEGPSVDTVKQAIDGLRGVIDELEEGKRDIDGFKRLAQAMAMMGYSWRVDDDSIYFCRRDGTCFAGIARTENDEKWLAVRAALQEMDAARTQQVSP